MAKEIFETLALLRHLTRRTTLLFAAAASVGLVLIPLAYRARLPESWIVILPTVCYFSLAAFRLLGGFQTDRQLEFEERFIRFADGKDRLLASAQGFGKLWKLSCLVQGLSLSEQSVAPDSERGKVLRRALGTSSRLLLPPAVRAAIPSLVLVAVTWIYVAATEPSARGIYLYAAVLPSLVGAGYLEAVLLGRRRQFRVYVSELVDRVASWGEKDWNAFRDQSNARPFRHRLFYRDRLLAG
jgi:hypothetical protein